MAMQDHFDMIADAELRALERALGELDPDELEVELSQGVLTCSFSDGQKLVVNSHHAAGQIWMAAFRRAWHFSPREDGAGKVEWRTDREELRSTLRTLLEEKLGHPVHV
jgi:CyaY protein